MKILNQTTTFFALIAIAAMFGGCAETKQAKTVQESGFLTDYSRLKPGAKDEALLQYKNPDANLKRYDKVMIVPVLIFKPQEASEAEVTDLQTLAGNFNTYLARELARDYQLVRAPEPGTLKIEAAITGADKSGRTMDLISSVLPIGMVVSAGKNFVTGKPTGVGESSAEIRITDAATGKVVAEAVDSRVGGKDPSGMFNAWNDADKAMEYWARRIAYVLCIERGDEGCVKP
jgi:hypothetical protein